MIRITCGTCGTTKGYKTSADGAITLAPEEEARLVARGVAAYETTPIISAAVSAVATAPVPPEEDGKGNDTPDKDGGRNVALLGVELPDEVDIVDGRFTEESLAAMTNSALAKLAHDLGLDAKRCRAKADYVALLSSIELDVDGQDDQDDDQPPDLSAEVPV